jgi:hypothetical protein
MKRVYLFIFVLLTVSTSVFSLEIGADFHIGNLSFAQTRTSDQTTFNGKSLPWGINAYVNHWVNEQIGIHTGYYMDSILKKTIYTHFTYKYSFLQLSVGPFFGLFNSRATLLKSGISTSIKLEFPGIAYIRFRTDSSIGGRIVQTGDYLQERNELAFGFYVPHAICSLGLQTKKYTEKVSTGETVDSLYIYSFSTDVFQKNVPYKVLVTFAFHQLSKTFIETAGTTVHSLNSIVAGFTVDIELADYLTLILGLDSSIYTFGTNALLGVTNPGPGGYLFNATAGIKLNMSSIIERRNL